MTLIRENATYKDVNTALLSLDTQIKNNNISILKKLNDTINNLDNSSSDDSKLKDDVASNTASINSLETDINSLETDINSLETDINSLKDGVASNTTSINSLETDINSLETSINSLKNGVASNTTSINSLETDINSLKDGVASNTTSINSLKDGVASNTTSINSLKDGVASNTTSINSLESSKLTIAQTNCKALGFTPSSKISLLTFVKKLISTYGNNAFIVFDWADARACYVTCKNTTALPDGLLLTGGYLLYRSNGTLNEAWTNFNAHYIASNGKIYLLCTRILDNVSNYQENMFMPVFTTDTKITAPTLQASSNLVIPTAAPATLTDGSIWVEA